MEEIKKIKFHNKERPNSSFELLKFEDLLSSDNISEIIKLHKIEFYHIIFITEGQGSHTIDFTDYNYSKGTVITISKNQVHKFFNNPDSKGYILIFTEDFLLSQLSKTEVLWSFQLFNELLSSPKLDLDSSNYLDIIRLIKNIEKEYKVSYDEYSNGIIRSSLHILISKLYRFRPNPKDKLNTLKYFEDFLLFQKLVSEKCFETKKVIDYANIMSVSTKTLNNICRAVFDKSAKEVINEILVLEIKRLLINTSLTIKEIAYQTGFEEPSNIFKYFRKYTNITPEGFRELHT